MTVVMSVKRTVADKTNPLGGTEPMKVARRVMDALWPAEDGVPGVVEFRGEVWAWEEREGWSRWCRMGNQKLEDRVRLGLEDAWVEKGKDGAVERFKVTNGKLVEVVDSIKTLAREAMGERSEAPCWLGAGDSPSHLGTTMAFRNCLVDVRGGELFVAQRTRKWFDTCTSDLDWYDSPSGFEKKCPTWIRAVEQWAGGDRKWVSLLQRVFGLAKMPGVHHQRWVLAYGRAGTGKSVMMNVMEELVGEESFFATDLESLAGPFGLDGAQSARIINIKEVTGLEGSVAEAASGVVKRVLSGEKQAVNIKHVRAEKNVRIRALPVMTSNMMPKLPNRAEGLSQKMLVLPFERVFRGQEGEDLGLEEKLRGELEGIAAWAVEGARQVEACGPAERWPVPAAAAEVLRGFQMANNPADGFLEARCVEAAEGFVPHSLLWREFSNWMKVNQVQVKVSKNRLTLWLVEEGTWELRRDRLKDGGERGLRGLRLKRDEHVDDQA